MTKLQQLLSRLGIGAQEWDLLLVGDGSGNRWEYPGGWAVLFLDRVSGTQIPLYGGVSRGSINSMELFPYLYALRYHYYALGGKKMKSRVNVHVVSDSEVTVKCGKGEYVRRANADLWSLVDFWKTQGYNWNWHYVEAHVEDEPEIHQMADELAGKSREAMGLAPLSFTLDSVLL